jgi:monoterpene epsilon-lactone hydrolase
MISWQARIVRDLLKTTTSKKSYNSTKINKHRKRFERNFAILFPRNRSVNIENTKIADVSAVLISPKNKVERSIIYLHGGGFVFGSSKTYQQHLARLAILCNANVISIDYSLSPENSFPVALNEIQKVWEELIKQGLNNTKTVIIGDSAGASLALGAALKFRDNKQKQPACLVLLSPALDATFSGKSYLSNKSKDVLLNMDKLNFFMQAYVQKHKRDDPFISTIFANLTGIPPFLIHVGSEELVLSDSETIMANAKRDNVKGTLYIGEGMWHGWHLFASYVPEAKAAMNSVVNYVILHTN